MACTCSRPVFSTSRLRLVADSYANTLRNSQLACQQLHGGSYLFLPAVALIVALVAVVVTTSVFVVVALSVLHFFITIPLQFFLLSYVALGGVAVMLGKRQNSYS